MKRILIVFMLCCAVLPCFSETRTIKTYTPVQNSSGYYCGSYNGLSDYAYAKVSEMENAVFGRNFVGQNLLSRIERLEDRVFNRLYPNSNIEQRVNNLIYNYNKSYATSYQPQTDSKLKNIVNGITSSFFGVPTGYTPPISNWGTGNFGTNYGNYGDYYGNNGWRRYGNSYGTGSGVHIID